MHEEAVTREGATRLVTPDGVKRTVPRIAWVVTAVTLLVLGADCLYLYALKFAAAIHSDATNTLHIAVESVRTRALVAPTWYWANGDFWVLGPQLYALPVVAFWGIGVKQLLGVVVFGFALQLVVLAWAYRGLTHGWLPSAVAAAVTLIAWSRIHVLFVYIELAYGFTATTYIAFFALFAAFAARTTERGARLYLLGFACAAYELVLAVQNPTRGLVFGLFPIGVAIVWPWRGFPLRARATVFVAALAGWVWARVIYRGYLLPTITLSIPSGHLDFVPKDLDGIVANVKLMGRGMLALSGTAEGFEITHLPVLLVILASIARVVFELFASRTLTRIRFVCLGTCVQFTAVLGPLAIGNLMVTPPSVRYLMPSLLGFLGLALLLAWDDLGKPGVRKKLATAWMALLAIGAFCSLRTVVGAYSLEYTKSGQWANRTGHAGLAAELSRRGLRHGFATYWNAGLVTVMSSGATKTCGIGFGRLPIPYKWNTDVGCFDAKKLPDRFYVVFRDDERKALEWMDKQWVEQPMERFKVGDEFDVLVFKTSPASTRWLDAPIPEGEHIHFPFRFRITHPQVGRVDTVVREEDDTVVATGAEGWIAYGPFITLPPGKFRVTWFGSGIDSEGTLTFDVVTEYGKNVFGAAKLAPESLPKTEGGKLVALDIDLPKRTQGIELRIASAGGARAAIEAVTIEKR